MLNRTSCPILCSLLIHPSQTSSSMLCFLLNHPSGTSFNSQDLNHRYYINTCSAQRHWLKPDEWLQCPCLYFKATEPSSWNIWKFNNSFKTNPDHALSSWAWLPLLWSSTCSKMPLLSFFFSFWHLTHFLELSSMSYPAQVCTWHIINSQKILICKLVISRYYTACTASRRWLVFSCSSIQLVYYCIS